MQTVITLHPTFSKTAQGYIPMVTARGSKGHMLGSRVPRGAAREFRTFTTRNAAISEAYLIALRCASRWPSVLRVA